MKRKTVWFVGPRDVQVRDEEVPPFGADQVLVRVAVTGISAGTEMLVYRGELPEATASEVDPVIRDLRYPCTFGYCSVGRVLEVGVAVSEEWKNRHVFAFQPHTSTYVASAESLIAVPEDVAVHDAVFLANTETAVNLVHDAAPLLGERVLVLGQGTVGLLTAAILCEFPLASVVTADLHPLRRKASEKLGVTAALDPAASDFISLARSHTGGAGFDIVIELTGNPQVLDHAVAAAAFSGRIIAGSWYGRRRAALDLGDRFHRSRIRLVSSQVSTIAPELSGRWDKPRRFDVAWDFMRRMPPSRWITHRFPLEAAARAFELVDAAPGSAIQVVLEYPAAA